jgi:hypothetical protein
MSFETKQKILRSVVEQVEFVGDQITIEHLIPVSDGKSSVNRFDALQPESTDKDVMKGNDRLGARSANCPAKVSTHVCKPFGCTNKFSASIAASPLKPMMV